MSEDSQLTFKKVLFLSKIQFSLLIVSILIFINYLDYEEMNSNRKALNLLDQMVTKEKAGQLQFEQYELQRLDSLSRIDSSLAASHTRARVLLVKTLNDYGAGINRASKGSNSDHTNKIILMANEPLLRSLKDPSARFYPSSSRNERPVKTREVPEDISGAIDLFNELEAETKSFLLSDIDATELNRQCDSLLQKNAYIRDSIGTPGARHPGTTPDVGGPGGPNPQEENMPKTLDSGRASLGPMVDHPPMIRPAKLFTTYYEFLGLAMQKNSIQIYYADKGYGSGDRFGGQGSSSNNPMSQQSRQMYALEIPAGVDSANMPSTLVLSGLPVDAIRQLSKKGEQRELRNLYGKAKMSMINDISVDLYKKNSESISILGFNLSRKWFPIALFLTLAAIAVMIYVSLRKSTLKITGAITSDDSLSFLLTSRWGRGVLWVASPLLIFFMVFYSSFIKYDWPVYSLVLVACICSVIAGVASFKISSSG